MSKSMRQYRRQPTRLRHPWDSPGRNTGMSCHFLLQCMKVKSESEVAHSCPTLSDPMDCSPPGSSIHEIFQPRVLEWGAIAFSVNVTKTIIIRCSQASGLHKGFFNTHIKHTRATLKHSNFILVTEMVLQQRLRFDISKTTGAPHMVMNAYS